MNRMKTNQKLIFDKLSLATSIGTSEKEENTEIDIFQDLPLKNETDLQAMESKLINDVIYRNEMVS